MAVELALVLLFIVIAGAIALFAGRKGLLGRIRGKGPGGPSLKIATTPATEKDMAAPPTSSWLSPSPTPATYETVQPKPAPSTGNLAASSWTALGASADSPRRTSNFRRRAVPTRSTATKDKTAASSG